MARRSTDRTRALVEATRLVAGSVGGDLDATLDALCEQARRLLDAEDACIDLSVDGGARLVRRRVSALALPDSSSARDGVRYTPTRHLAEAFDRRTLLFSADFQHDERVGLEARRSVPSAVARLAVPLVVGDDRIGVLFVHWARPHRPTPIELELAETLGHHAAAAIHTAQLLEANRRARAETEAVLDSVDDSIMVYAVDGRLVRTNRRARERFVERIGRVPDTLGEFVDAARPTHPDGTPVDEPLAARALRGEAGSETLVYAYPDGPRHFHVHAAPLRDADGAVWGAVLVSRDITELRSTIAHNAQLDGAIKTARRVAHELNNALTFLAGYGELLPGLVPPGDAAEMATEMAQAATEAGQIVLRLQRIVRFEETASPVGPMLDLEAAQRHGKRRV